jgi:heme/copper-type cytochrome/quinol oxidase subunit 2
MIGALILADTAFFINANAFTTVNSMIIASDTTEPMEQTGSQALSLLEIQEIVIIALVVLVVVLAMIVFGMHWRNRAEKKNHNQSLRK